MSAIAAGVMTKVVGDLASKVSNEVYDATLSSKIKGTIEKITRGSVNKKAANGIKLLERIKSDENYNYLINNIYLRHLQIKTISRKNESIYIDDIYVKMALDNEITERDIYERDNVSCIIGIAGHGKSTLMKKTLLEILRDGRKLPIFIDLRDVKDGNITNHIRENLSLSNIESSSEEIISILYSRRVILLLDGFDEVEKKLRKKVCDEIDTISTKYKCKIIVSSRPETEICHHHTTTNNIHTLKNMSDDDVIDLVEKLIEPASLDHVKRILSKNSELMSSLKTPILVSMFCASYPYSDTIPNSAKEYYARIFDVMYEGHDKDKNYFGREKLFPGEVSDIKKIFNAYCYGTSIEGNTSFDRDYAIDMLDKTLGAIGQGKHSDVKESIFSDLVNVTSLIISDGNERFTFIHRTIQEYHAALYIKDAIQEKKVKYQNKIKDKLLSGDGSLVGVCAFLFQLDKENTAKYVMIPMMENIGFNTHEEINDIVEKIANNLISTTTIHMVHKTSKAEFSRNNKKAKSLFPDSKGGNSQIYMYGFNSKRKIQAPMEPFFSPDFFQEGWVHDTLKSLCTQKHLDWLEKETKEIKGDDNVYGAMEALNFLEQFNLKDSFIKRLSPKLEKIYSKYKVEKNEIADIETDHDLF